MNWDRIKYPIKATCHRRRWTGHSRKQWAVGCLCLWPSASGEASYSCLFQGMQAVGSLGGWRLVNHMQPLSGLFSRPHPPMASRLGKAIVQEHTCPNLPCGHFLTCWNSITGSFRFFPALASWLIFEQGALRALCPPPGSLPLLCHTSPQVGSRTPCLLKHIQTY